MVSRVGITLLAVAVAVVAVVATVRVPARADLDRHEDRPAGAARGELVTAHPIRSLPTAGDVRAELTDAGFATDSVRFGVDAYQVVYRTVGVDGTPTVASGLLTLPRNQVRSLRTVSYAHGTELNRTDAPSLWRDGWTAAPAVTYASAGFAAVAPDYLGLGIGPGLHPYLHLPSEATASLDLLRAARAFAQAHGRHLQRDVFVTGFSQGATAATALGHTLQDREDGWFRLAALAPIAGAYAFGSVELPALLDGTVPAPYNLGYSAYLVVAWERIHDLYQHPSEIFAAPYAAHVEQLFDGLRTGEDLVGGLPGRVEDLFTDRGLALLRQPSGRFAEALAHHDASCGRLEPGSPVRLLASSADEQVPAANSEACQVALRAAGVEAPIVELGDRTFDGSTHLGANVTGVAHTVEWFQQLG